MIPLLPCQLSVTEINVQDIKTAFMCKPILERTGHRHSVADKLCSQCQGQSEEIIMNQAQHGLFARMRSIHIDKEEWWERANKYRELFGDEAAAEALDTMVERGNKADWCIELAEEWDL